MNYEFASDNTAPAAPEVLAAIAEANVGHVLSYGDDPWTARMQATMTAAFAAAEPVGVVPILSGKLANHLSLATITEPGGLIFCHEHAHVMIDEYDGPPYVTRCRMVSLPGEQDKIEPDTLRAALDREFPLPPESALSLTNVTEAGAVYTLAELAELVSIAHTAGLLVHLDGARIANAIAALDCELADMTWRLGIDVLSLGATKNGGLGAEAVVTFDPAVSTRLRHKQLLLGHAPSKMRFLSAQLIAWLNQDGWRKRAAYANAAALRLATGLRELPGVRIVQPVDANMIFTELPEELQRVLDDEGYYLYPMPMYGESVVRFVTSWTTPDASIERILELLGSESIVEADAD
jgi:threonine aldolase